MFNDNWTVPEKEHIMALSKEKTAAVVAQFGANEKDTGNTKVQVALLTERIKQLTESVTFCDSLRYLSAIY